MKVGLILPGNIWFSPYVRIYTQILEELGVDYDIVSWNRDGSDRKEGFQFEMQCSNDSSRISKFLPYIHYISYVKKIIIQNDYERLIVFGPQIGIFINHFLTKRYKKRYVFDYRDLSIEQKNIFKIPFLSVLKNSFANVISSPGFVQCLPKRFNYLLSHNFDITKVTKAIEEQTSIEYNHDVVNVLTIGGIRDYESNISVVNALCNKTDFKMSFVGKGIAADRIKEYVVKNDIKNVEFEGYYPKEKEGDYIQRCSMLNIFYPKIQSHSTALSNRFYNSLIYKKPMIVTSNSTQGDYVEKYGLGLSLDNCSNLDEKINKYLSNFNYKEFIGRCNELLELFLKDTIILKSTIKDFLK